MSEQLVKKEKPIHAVFISDLHLHPDREDITHYFFQFLEWAMTHVDSLYILGDFFHVWAGDDAMDEWSSKIAYRLAGMADLGIKCYFLAGNRDFLLGKQFATLAKWEVLPDPYLLQLDEMRVLLSHGDRFCTKDKAHQWFRRLTRWRGFTTLFGLFPLSLRKKWVTSVRQYSASHNKTKSNLKMDVVDETIFTSVQRDNANVLIHGHTHTPKVVKYSKEPFFFTRYVLSDWDDNPAFLCYYKTYGFKLELMS